MARRPRFSRGEARRDALIEAPRRAARLVGRGVEGEAHLEVGHVRAEEAHGAPAHGSYFGGGANLSYQAEWQAAARPQNAYRHASTRSGSPPAVRARGGPWGWPAEQQR